MLRSRYYLAIFAIVLVFTAGLYSQGLHGVFILDDDQNLNYLNYIEKADFWATTAQLLSEAVASSLGRPLALLSFAFQYEAYPDNIQAFKAVNILLHLLNGCLIFSFILLLSRLLKLSTQHGLFLALCTASIWLLNPLQVSTVLYVVQRMTQLATFFSLLGLIVYLLGREAIAYNKPIRGFLLTSSGIGLGIILATLSKENGILLVLLVLVLEWTVLVNYTKPRYWSLWLTIFVYFPIIILFSYLTGILGTIRHLSQDDLLLYSGLILLGAILIESIIWAWVTRQKWKNLFRVLFYSPIVLTILYASFNPDIIAASYSIRDFNLIERLLTQSHVLTEYIAKILLIYPIDYGLFHDDFPIARSLFSSISITVIFILGLIGLGIWVRKIYPFIALGILWFFAAHVLESSFIGLVLYFEHRNYLPSIGIIFTLVYIFWMLLQFIPHRYKKLLMTIAALWFVASIGLTWSQINIWANPIQQAGVWASYKPESRYAQSHAASIAVQLDKPKIAEQYYHHMLQTFPNDTGPYMMLLLLACHFPDEVLMPDIEQEVLPQLQRQDVGTAALSSLMVLLDKWQTCEGLNRHNMDKIFQVLLTNAQKAYIATVYRIYAMFKAQTGDYMTAIDMMSQAIELKSSPSLYFLRIEWAYETKDIALTSLYLDAAYRDFNPFRQYAFHKQLSYWNMRIELANPHIIKP